MYRRCQPNVWGLLEDQCARDSDPYNNYHYNNNYNINHYNINNCHYQFNEYVDNPKLSILQFIQGEVNEGNRGTKIGKSVSLTRLQLS